MIIVKCHDCGAKIARKRRPTRGVSRCDACRWKSRAAKTRATDVCADCKQVFERATPTPEGVTPRCPACLAVNHVKIMTAKLAKQRDERPPVEHPGPAACGYAPVHDAAVWEFGGQAT